MTPESIKQSFQQHRTKSLLLGLLLLVLVGVVFQTMFRTSPRPATANTSELLPASSLSGIDSIPTDQLSARLSTSKKLWTVLRQVQGPSVEQAFAFDSRFYALDASRIPQITESKRDHLVETPTSTTTVVAGTPSSPDDLLKNQASELHLQSTVMGDVPLAVINGDIFRAGQDIHGFRIVAIGPGQVDVEKHKLKFTLKISK